MSSFEARSDVLRSGNDGVYDVSFFAASIKHTIGLSRSVFEKLSGPSLAGHHETWLSLSDNERTAYLLEHHELAHHALMFSTPCGVLNWRMNQVVSRDVQWILRKCDELGIPLDTHVPPRQVVTTRVWQSELKRRNDIPRQVKLELLRTIKGLEDVLKLRSILFEPGSPARNPDLTFQQMRGLLSRSFAYLEMRCDITLRTKWTTRLPGSTKVFPEGRNFNLVDIAEVHAIAMELFVLRAAGDLDRFHKRTLEAATGSYATAFRIARDATVEVNELGLSPHQMQILALVAFSVSFDVTSEGSVPVYLEDALPWWRFARGRDAFAIENYQDSLRNCVDLATRPLTGTGSRWMTYRDVELSFTRKTGFDNLQQAIQTATTLGLDRQIHAIHSGANLNWRYLMTQFEEATGVPIQADFERLPGEQWRGEVQRAVLLVEYKDGIYFNSADFEKLYPPDNPMRTLRHLMSYSHPGVQVIGQILNGAVPRVMYAAYAGCVVPALETLQPKLADHFQSAEIAKSLAWILGQILERATAANRFLTLMPKSVPLERYI